MSHHVVKSGYRKLVDRLNRFPQGAPAGPLLFRILSLLFSEREAELVSRLPIMPFTVRRAARALGMSEPAAAELLDGLAGRALLLDVEREEESVYLLPPPMAGFFEFALMRVRADIDQQALSELFYKYLNVEEEFIRELFTRGETRLGRILVHEPALSAGNSSRVLDYERASAIIRSARHIGVGICYCRHKMSHLGKACGAPQEICLSLDTVADSLSRHGQVRSIDRSEALDLLQQARENRLVQFADNVREEVNFICNCCGCCCEALLAARRFAHLHPVHTTNFMPVLREERCNGCGHCAAACPVAAVEFVPRPEQGHPARKQARFLPDICLGCGICVSACAAGAVHLESRANRVITPVNSAHRVVLMAIERGCLQHLIFDNQAHLSHRAMAAILGAILRLPPVKQVMASRQMRSRYLERLLAGVDMATMGR
jgi:MinD superfamily P-loop ATPase